MNRLVFVCDAHRCSGCLACITACQDQHDLPEAIALRQVSRRERGPYPARITFCSSTCRHCGEAACLDACPAGAISRHSATGAVIADAQQCTGCGSCAAACPFEVPQFDANGRMLKCDGCHVRLENGLDPACVHTCTTGALRFEITGRGLGTGPSEEHHDPPTSPTTGR